jgi:hypothetical protein
MTEKKSKHCQKSPKNTKPKKYPYGVGVYIVGVFRLYRDPSLVSWEREIFNLANANEL